MKKRKELLLPKDLRILLKAIEKNRPIGHFAGCNTPQSPISTIVLRDSNV